MLRCLPDFEEFASEVQRILYYIEGTEKGFMGRWDPDKPWDADVLDLLAELMERYGLVPEREEDE